MVKLGDYDVVVFDLDDTLYPERSYVLSGYSFLSNLLDSLYSLDTYGTFLEAMSDDQEDVLGYVLSKHELPSSLKEHLVLAYRYHHPKLELHDGALILLDSLIERDMPIYLITDGRSITQRLKLRALNIQDYFKQIFISEEVGVAKPEIESFKIIDDRHVGKKIVYIADNPKKDFVAPELLGWKSVGVLHVDTRIHPLIENHSEKANIWLKRLSELKC